MAGSAMISESKSLEAFAKRALDQHAYNAQAIRVPSEHASEADRAEFRERLMKHVPTLVELDPANPDSYQAIQRTMGMPEAVDGYQTPEMDLGDYASPSMDAQLAHFRELAHASGLTNAQYQNLVKGVAETQARARMHLAEQHQAELAELKQEWGLAYETKMSQAKAVLSATGAPENLVNAFESGQVDATTQRWLAGLHEVLSGGQALENHRQANDGPRMETPAEAQAKIDEIRSNREHPYHSRAHPRHAWAMQEMQRLYKLALGEGGQQPHMQAQEGIMQFEGRG